MGPPARTIFDMDPYNSVSLENVYILIVAVLVFSGYHARTPAGRVSSMELEDWNTLCRHIVLG